MTDSVVKSLDTAVEDLAEKVDKKLVVSDDCREKLKSYLGLCFRIEITDGRTIYGNFCCTDHAGNIILENSVEYMPNPEDGDEPRVLGLAMIGGKHVVSIARYKNNPSSLDTQNKTQI